MRIQRLLFVVMCSFLFGSCIFGKKASGGSGAKSGCPSNGKNVGAEKILSGEKVPKAPKFKS
jgi:hypothetical protein